MRFRFLSALTMTWLTACAIPLTSAHAADSYPNRPIRLVVGFSSGGSTDQAARLLARSMSEQLGQPVVIDNRAGAGGGIALQHVATAPADGYTLIMLTASSTTLGLTRKVPFDVEKDFAPVGLTAIGPMILTVGSSLKIRSVSELIELAKAKPGQLSYGTSGVGTPSHLAGVLLDQIAHINTIHVPFKGSSENVISTAAGDVTMSFPDALSSVSMLQTGRTVALGVTTAKRASFLPSIPTLDESGLKGLVLPLWFGIAAPANTPPGIIAKLHAAIDKTVNAPGIKESMNKLGLDPERSTPEEFRDFIRDQIEINARLIKASGMQVEK